MKECKWSYDENYDVYDTECENSFQFIDGTPDENGFKSCPYCGFKIK